jgi:hypothetical protein
VRPVKGGSDFLHEALHLFLHHGVRLEAVVEVQDYLADTRRLDRLQVRDDLLGRADENGLGCQVLGLHVAQDIHDLHEVLKRRGRRLRVAGKRGDQGVLEIAKQRFLAEALVLRGGRDVEKITAHRPPGMRVVTGLFGVECLHALGQTAVDHCRRERREDDVPIVARGQFHGNLGKARHVGPQRLLRGFGGYLHVLETVVLALMRPAPRLRPSAPQQRHPLGEEFRGVVEGSSEGGVLHPVVAAPRREVHAPPGEQVQRGPLLGDQQRMMHGEQHHGRSQPHAPRRAGQLRKQDVGAGVDTEQVEMVLAHPHGMQTHFLRVERLLVDLANELFGSPGVAGIAIVAEREVAEIHNPPSFPRE